MYTEIGNVESMSENVSKTSKRKTIIGIVAIIFIFSLGILIGSKYVNLDNLGSTHGLSHKLKKDYNNIANQELMSKAMSSEPKQIVSYSKINSEVYCWTETSITESSECSSEDVDCNWEDNECYCCVYLDTVQEKIDNKNSKKIHGCENGADGINTNTGCDQEIIPKKNKKIKKSTGCKDATGETKLHGCDDDIDTQQKNDKKNMHISIKGCNDGADGINAKHGCNENIIPKDNQKINNDVNCWTETSVTESSQCSSDVVYCSWQDDECYCCLFAVF